MKYLACIKQVPDVSTPIRIKDGALHMDSTRMVLNAYDASAVEQAIVLSAEHGGSLEVVMIAPEKGRETLRKALAMGASKGYHIICEQIADCDPEIFAAILSRFTEKTSFDVVLTGKQSQDSDAGLTGSMLAEKRNLPYVSNAVDITTDGAKLTVTRQGDTGQEVFELPPPCLITCSNDMNTPRIPNLKGIMQSKKKPVETITLEDLGLDIDQLLNESRKIEYLGYREVPGREPGHILEDEPGVMADKLITFLDRETGVF